MLGGDQLKHDKDGGARKYMPDVPVVSVGVILEGGMLDRANAELRIIDFENMRSDIETKNVTELTNRKGLRRGAVESGRSRREKSKFDSSEDGLELVFESDPAYVKEVR